VHQDRGIEVHEKGDSEFRGTQIAQRLRVMDWRKSVNRFHFKKNGAPDHKVHTLLRKHLASVADRECPLHFERDFEREKLEPDGFHVNALE
jgi:hypothetical protein